MRRVLALLLAGAFIASLGACAPPRPLPREKVVNIVPEGSPYDYHAARELLGQALIDERSGEVARARDGFRQAALTWPGLTRAWRGLARTSEQAEGGRAEGGVAESEAADFLAARTRLTDPNDILTQRQLASALRTYLEEQAAAPDANPLTLEYGGQLASFYADLYETRGTYTPPRPFGNIKPNEMPTAIVTGIATSIYIGTVLMGTESAR